MLILTITRCLCPVGAAVGTGGGGGGAHSRCLKGNSSACMYDSGTLNMSAYYSSNESIQGVCINTNQ